MKTTTPAKSAFAHADNNLTVSPAPAAGCEQLLIGEKQFRLRYGVGKTTTYRLLNLRDPHNAAIRSLKLGTRRLIEVRSADAYFARLLETQIGGAAQ